MSRCLNPLASSAAEASAAKTKRTPANATPESLGEKLEIEPQIGRDEATVELAFSVGGHQPAGLSPKRLGSEEKVNLRDGSPTLLRAVAVPSAKGSHATTVRALILQANIVDARGLAPPPPRAPQAPHQ